MSESLRAFDRLSPAKQKLLLARLQKKEAAARPQIPPSPRRAEGGPYPLSFAQQRLWFLHRLDPADVSYNLTDALKLSGRLDPALLERCLTEIVRRHEALRTVFEEREGRPVQRILPPMPVAVPRIDLSGLEAARREAEAVRLVREESRLPFDLDRGPHLRARLLRLAPGEHAALFTMHHIVSDGWSMGVLVREVAALYAAFSAGAAPPLPELPVQYPDFADWQRRHLTGEALEEQLGYWRGRLAGAPAVLELPTDRPRPAVQTTRGANLRIVLPPPTAEGLGRLIQEEGATLFMGLLAAYGALLSRCAGQEDLTVGTVVANRNRIETEGLIGFLVNTLVLRIDLSGEPEGPTFRELLGRVKTETLGAFAHQDLPFERLVEELHPARDLSRSPLFQVAFSLQNAPAGDLVLPGLDLAPFAMAALAAETSLFDLGVDAAETADGVVLDWRYNTDLFDEATVRRFAEQLEALLAAAVAEPDRPLGELPPPDGEERRLLLNDWGTGPAAQPGLCLHELFAAQAARDPQAWAVAQGGERWTYGEVAARAGQIAEELVAYGVEPEARVGVFLERSIERLAALLGVLQAGGAYVPLDPAYPQDRLAFMAEDAGLGLVLVTERTVERFPDLPVPTMRVDAVSLSRAERGGGPGRGLPIPTTPENTAYVIYTSGSTGRPKGVAIPHKAVTNNLLEGVRLLGMRPGDRVLQSAAFSFDGSLLDTFGPLAAGACVHLAAGDRLPSGPELAALWREEAITVSILPPSVLATFEPGDFPGLRVLAVGGEACPAELARKWSAGRKLWNVYGPTEATIILTTWAGTDWHGEIPPPVGRPMGGGRAFVLDRQGRLAPAGAVGELCLGGVALARGYRNQPDRTAEAFVPDPFSGRPGERLYRTGDLARWSHTGDLHLLGRADQQVKLRGFRIELGEIRSVLEEHPEVRQGEVLLRPGPGGPRLVAYAVPREGADRTALPAGLRSHLRAKLPEVMVPAAYVVLDEMPLTPVGKLDRAALPVSPVSPATEGGRTATAAPRAGFEREIAAIWQELLGVEAVGSGDSFFDLGGHSLLLVQVQSRLRTRLGEDVELLDLFRHPTVATLARHLEERHGAGPVPLAVPERRAGGEGPEGRMVAIVGRAGRFPKAPDLEAFWRNLRDGVEAISFFSREELEAAGVPAALLDDPAYVPAAGVLDGADLFDAPFFGISPREAELIDPQQRLFLECAAEALDDAGYGAGSPALKGGSSRVGVYAGAGMSSYALRNLLAHPDAAGLQGGLGNENDFLATRVAYKLDLRGPALTVQTACSTSLVAVHLACKALLDGECDVAIAGGVTVQFPQVSGYLYDAGGIVSPDGHNRAFDAGAGGTVGGNGVGAVVLKPLAAALADGDTVRAVIRATAINNDGGGKIGYTAPSEEGQAEVIAGAQALAGVEPETVRYVEAHGSATPIGDPIEVAALTRAFRARTGRIGFCAIGSVKSNVGHTGSAAGIAGLLKAVLALEHREIPPSLHFKAPNPRIDFAASPFYVAAALEPWLEEGGVPRRAGVSSFGLGGTNAHAVLEEAPLQPSGSPGREWQVLAISARTARALEAATDRLAGHLERHSDQDLADVAYTIGTGRRGFEHRRVLVCRGAKDAAEALYRRDPRRLLGHDAVGSSDRPVAFLLAGVGEQYPGMAAGLYRSEAGFREPFDHCAEMLRPLLGLDLRELLFAGPEAREREAAAAAGPDLRRMLGRPEGAASPLDRTEVAQPALFAVEYALARLWSEWGIEPVALLGYSLGEYVAACLSGVLSLEDALRLVAERSRIVAGLPEGAMLAVPLPEGEILPLLSEDLSLAIVNGPRQSVVAGPAAAVAALEERLTAEGHATRRLRTSRAFHSEAMRPAAGRLTDLARQMALRPPKIPYLSNVSGTWITSEQAADPGYWAEHLCRTVRFSEGLAELWREPSRVLLEIGPGGSLSAMALQSSAAEGLTDPVTLPSLPSVYERRPDAEFLLETLGKLWLAGVRVDWSRLYIHERRKRVPLPAYPFERRRYWLEPASAISPLPVPVPIGIPGLQVPSWRRAAPLPPPEGLAGRRVLLFTDGSSLAARIEARLRGGGAEVVTAAPGERFAETAAGSYTLDPARREDYGELLWALRALPERVVHLWSLASADPARGSFSLLSLVHALAARTVPGEPSPLGALRALVISSGLQRVTAAEALTPDKLPLAALCDVLPLELGGVACRCVDVDALESGRERPSWREEALAEALLAELEEPETPETPETPEITEAEVAYRGAERWVQAFEPAGPDSGGRRAPGSVAVVLLGGFAGAKAGALAGLAADSRIGRIVDLGIEPPRLPLALFTSDELRAHLQRAAERMTELAAGLEEKAERPDLCLLLAPLESLVPQAGSGLRAAAFRWAEAFAQERSRVGSIPWTAIVWDPEAPSLAAVLERGYEARVAVSREEIPSARRRRSQESEGAEDGAGAPGAHGRPDLRNPYVAPETEAERFVADAWQRLLGVDRVGVHDRFFDLGGDSLLATQVVTRVRERFGVSVPLPEFFEQPTPAALAGQIEALREGRSRDDAAEIARMIEELEGLSAEEVDRLLAQRGLSADALSDFPEV